MDSSKKSPFVIIGRLLWGLYNIVTTYLLGWVLLLGTLALGFHFLTEVIVDQFGFDRADQWWDWVEWRLGVSSVVFRLPLYLMLQGAVIYLSRPLWKIVQEQLDAFFRGLYEWFRDFTEDHADIYIAFRGMFTIAVTLVLIPFVFQPTLVGGGMSGSMWMERAANLADGTASRHVIDSVAGTYRRLFVEDISSYGGIDAEDLEDLDDDPDVSVDDDVEAPDDDETEPGPVAAPAPAGSRPLMDRWDSRIDDTVDGDPTAFAQVKAFMRVESSGRQFAVSPTGCSGLMQFCVGTARRPPFRSIFGRGSVYPCNCSGQCTTPERVSRALETGDREEIADLEGDFPCDLTDARFDGEKSIEAGATYIERLADDYDDNLYLMYIGYNSGPGVANTVWRRVNRNADADLDDISPHLANALRPHFHGAANQRARSLLNTHLPRLRRFYDGYYQARQVAMHTAFSQGSLMASAVEGGRSSAPSR